ncbi:uncharacterized protein METZ01_LOCUS10607 [marine metagenome]|uniref:Uncharacterized protein n=1 Tax=marine metagenome TaxID=408172 RepID=A0A381NW99_9ZZZZ
MSAPATKDFSPEPDIIIAKYPLLFFSNAFRQLPISLIVA